MSRKELGSFIASCRDEAGEMPQAALADGMGVRVGTIYRWERGISLIEPKKLGRLADCLGLEGDKRQRLYELYAGAKQEESQETISTLRRENLEMLQDLRNALTEIKRFSDTYQSFHAAYQQIGERVEQLFEEVAEIKRAVLDRSVDPGPRPARS